LLLGKTYSKEGFVKLLQAFGQIDITTQVWQYDYDLLWSIKPDDGKAAEGVGNLGRGPIDLLRCPTCRTPLEQAEVALTCRSCKRRYPIGADGVIELL
jgi:hypothetical protein